MSLVSIVAKKGLILNKAPNKYRESFFMNKLD